MNLNVAAPVCTVPDGPDVIRAFGKGDDDLRIAEDLGILQSLGKEFLSFRDGQSVELYCSDQRKQDSTRC